MSQPGGVSISCEARKGPAAIRTRPHGHAQAARPKNWRPKNSARSASTVENQFDGLDSEVISSIELFPLNRQHCVCLTNIDSRPRFREQETRKDFCIGIETSC